MARVKEKVKYRGMEVRTTVQMEIHSHLTTGCLLDPVCKCATYNEYSDEKSDSLLKGGSP